MPISADVATLLYVFRVWLKVLLNIHVEQYEIEKYLGEHLPEPVADTQTTILWLFLQNLDHINVE
jgi:hypothetical protein